MKTGLALGALFALLTIAACAGAPGPGTGTSPGRTAAPAGGTPAPGGTAAAGCNEAGGGQAVSAVDNAFEPASVTVAVGETVTWTNDGATAHTVTFDDVDCGTIAPGESVSRTFDAAGTFDYVCTFHPPDMIGSVTVGE